MTSFGVGADSTLRQFLLKRPAGTVRFPWWGINTLTPPRKTTLTKWLFAGTANLSRTTCAAREADATPSFRDSGIRAVVEMAIERAAETETIAVTAGVPPTVTTYLYRSR